MKKIYGLLLIIAVFGFQSCEGPEGPPGIDGRDGVDGVDGEDGGLFLSEVYEAQVDFTEEGGYQAVFNLEMYDADNILIYLALGLDDQENPIWMPLPQTFFIENGMVIYNYIFSKQRLSIFLDASVPPADLGEEFTTNQYFRIVILPGQFPPQNGRVDLNDYNAVMKWLGKEEKDIEVLLPN